MVITTKTDNSILEPGSGHQKVGLSHRLTGKKRVRLK